MKPWQGLILHTYSGEGVLESEHFTDSYEIVLPSSTPLRPTARRYDLLELHLSVYFTDLTFTAIMMLLFIKDQTSVMFV